MVKMPYKFKRDCQVCGKPELLSLSDHLRQVHRLKSHERKQWLRAAVFSGSKKSLGITQGVSRRFTQLLHTEKERSRERKRTIAAVKEMEKTQHCIVKRPKFTDDVSLETKAYPEFMFRHKFSLLVVGPTQCGKTFFVKKILTTDRILYESKKPRRIPTKDTYKVMQSSIGKELQFFRGLPEFKEDLREIDPKFNNVLVFDDLMAQATDSPLISLLFTQGRHRNASVILLLQNMFPKGKFNTDISRNAQYMALFRSPSDRKQLGIIAERMFDKNRPRFMSAYFQETERAFGYIFVDNRPDTPSDKQVLSNIFVSSRRYPTINSSAKSVETVKTTSYKENIACEARSAVKSPPVVKSSLPIVKRTRPFPFDTVWSEAAYPVVQNYMQGAPRCQTLPKDFGITEMYRIARHLYDPYLPSYSYGNYWPVKIRHYCNGKSKWIYLHKDDLSVRSFLEKNQTNTR